MKDDDKDIVAHSYTFISWTIRRAFSGKLAKEFVLCFRVLIGGANVSNFGSLNFVNFEVSKLCDLLVSVASWSGSKLLEDIKLSIEYCFCFSFSKFKLNKAKFALFSSALRSFLIFFPKFCLSASVRRRDANQEGKQYAINSRFYSGEEWSTLTLTCLFLEYSTLFFDRYCSCLLDIHLLE